MREIEESTKHNRSLYALLHVAKQDLHQASWYATYLLKKGWHFEALERRQSTYMQQSAFTTSLVVSYARPFTESRGFLKFPLRLLQYNPEQKSLHSYILKLRNEVYAHTDVDSRKVRPFKFEQYATAVEFLPSLMLSKEKTEMLCEMTRSAQ